MAAVGTPQPPARAEAPAKAESKPIYLFAAVGAIAFIIAAQGWIQWFFSDDFNPAIPTGPDDYDMIWFLRGMEIASALTAVLLLWLFLFRPWIRDGEISFDGKLVIGMMIGYFWEPLVNYYNYTFAFNGHSVNFGTWADYIPGFTYPNQAFLPDGTLYALPQYMYSGVLLSLIGAWWLRYCARRFPSLSILNAWIALFFLLAAIWLPFEYLLFILPEVWNYASVVSDLSLFDGEYHQFPIYEGFIMAFFGLGVTYLRVSRDDRGRTFAEKGIDSISPRWRNKVSVFAVSGVVMLWTGFAYFGPWTWLQVQADSGAALNSYMRNGLCGEGTKVACPSGEVPLPNRESIKIGPNDPRLSQEARDAQDR